MSERKVAAYLWNITSLIGILLAVLSTALIIGLMAVEFFAGKENPYLGILTFFIFPGMLIFGLLLIPLGMYAVRSKLRKGAPQEIPRYPRLDLNDPHKRFLFIFFIAASVVFVLIVVIATIRGYEFTESTTFCGELCHPVMTPEHTAWSNSPHARVRCVECHVGPGAKWYVKAKISGMKQMYAVLAKTYPTPIETPIENLRPAKDTCLTCHWPEKFYAGRQKMFYHFAPNEGNTPRQINLLLKIAYTPKAPNEKGIHGHIGKDITYIPRDRKRQDIPYVAVTEKDGRVTEYVSSEKPLSKEELAHAEKRTMDCIDCHNRPTHIYRSPSQEMDESFMANRIDKSLPYMKKVAIEVLSRPYKSTEEANVAIARDIPAYYKEKYPKIAVAKAAAITQAVSEIQGIFSRNFFPHMKVQWNTYPDNIGHFYFPGCFRCHDGKHKSPDGKVISKDCNLCHQVIGQVQENVKPGTNVTHFVHPVDLGDEIMKTNCSDCHSAAVPEEDEQKQGK